MTENTLVPPVSRRGFVRSILAGASLSCLPGQLGGQSSALENAAAVTDREPGSAAASHHPSDTLIGNVHPTMPGAIAFIRNGVTGIVLDIGSDSSGRPGSTAPDFSYGTSKFAVNDADVTLEWGRVGEDSAVFRIRTDREVELAMTLPANPWRPFHHYFSSAESGLDALAVTALGEYIAWSLRADPSPQSSSILFSTHATVEVLLTPEKPLRMVAGYANLPPLGSIDSTLDTARSRHMATRARAEGAWGDYAGAIADNLNNNRLYSSMTNRMGNVIGRSGWLIEDPDYLPYFTWDTSFNGLLASIEDPETAKETIRTVLRYQLPNGMVSQLADWHGGSSGIVNMGNSNPPVTSLCAWKLYQRWGDKQFLEAVYPRLLRWHDWWPEHSDGNQNGLLEWGSTNGFHLALLSTGWDDTPHFDGCKMVGTQMTADAVDLNSLWSLDAEVLAKMASMLGRTEDTHRLRSEHEEMNRRINETLWNEELGLYCSRLWSDEGQPGAFLTRVTPMNFYPLLCGAPDAKRAARVLATLTDPKKFWGEWPVPTLPYDDPEYFKQTYWKGHVWGPVNYMIWQGLRRYGTHEQQAVFARRSVELFMRNWTSRGTCNENYFSTTGMGDDHPHYTWGALLCQIGVEALYDIDAGGNPFGLNNAAITESLELHNMPAGGKLYTISSNRGKVSIRLET